MKASEKEAIEKILLKDNLTAEEKIEKVKNFLISFKLHMTPLSSHHDYLVANAQKKSIKTLAKELGYKDTYIRTYFKTHNIDYPRWMGHDVKQMTEEGGKFLLENFGKYSTKALAQKTGFSERQIERYCYKNGVYKPNSRKSK